jgi:hypothetical protein
MAPKHRPGPAKSVREALKEWHFLSMRAALAEYEKEMSAERLRVVCGHTDAANHLEKASRALIAVEGHKRQHDEIQESDDSQILLLFTASRPGRQVRAGC